MDIHLESYKGYPECWSEKKIEQCRHHTCIMTQSPLEVTCPDCDQITSDFIRGIRA